MNLKKPIGTIAVFAMILFVAASSNPQQAEYSWQDEMCEYKGKYDQEKLSPDLIRDIRTLIDSGKGLPLGTAYIAWNPEEIDQLNVEALDREYKAKRTMLQTLKLGGNKYFEKLRTDHIATLERFYKLGRLALLAHKTPSVLREHNPGGNCFKTYGAPLEKGGDSLLAAWKRLNEEQRKQNSDPGRLKRRFEERYASAERMSYALLDVIGFGWWNCVNKTIGYPQMDGSAENEFKKLFMTVRTKGCDEP